MKHLFFFLKEIHGHTGSKLYYNIMAMMGIGLLDGIGILLLIPMISMSGIVSMDVQALPFTSIFQVFDDIPVSFGLLIILFIYLVIAVGQNVLQRHITIRNAEIQQGFLRYLQISTYHSLLKANWPFFVKKRKSDLIHLLTTEIGKTNAGTQSFLHLLASFVFTVLQITLAMILSPTITSFVLLCGLILIFLNRKFLKMSMKLGTWNLQLGQSYLAGITDQMNGIKDIKSNSLENPRLHWYESITKEMQDQHVDYAKLKATSQAYYKMASALFIAAFIFVAVQMFAAQAAQLMLVIVIFSRLWPRVAGIQSSLEQVANTIPSLRAVQSLQRETELAREFDHEMKADPFVVHEGIQCKDAWFRYDKEQEKYALRNINVFIPANKVTAIVGKSGAGKSTFVDLLMGLIEPEKGSIMVDGKHLNGDCIQALRKTLSYVPQDPFLFNTTIRENLVIVAPEATEEELWEALDFASALFVKDLHDGLDTMIGDRGIKLSGGERQRLVLARAILRKPSILVLDEATSSLDTENEQKIQHAIERLKGWMTIIVIAHRLSTIREADQVLVLEDGLVIQQGSYQQLSTDKGAFRRMLSTQELVGG
ncbi:ABC transporter ATP-binding protein [Evansella sp. AB-rgal1]|uniref:ABC transporter ATP-binding protein n=1 Tax=Evansella sp. AB-rgal1 TaxID=3242696 RepID=UPI00359E8CA1